MNASNSRRKDWDLTRTQTWNDSIERGTKNAENYHIGFQLGEGPNLAGERRKAEPWQTPSDFMPTVLTVGNFQSSQACSQVREQPGICAATLL